MSVAILVTGCRPSNGDGASPLADTSRSGFSEDEQALRVKERAASPGTTHDIGAMRVYDYGIDEAPPIDREAIDERAVVDSPAWDPAKSNPPISVQDAMALADMAREKKRPDTEIWKWGLQSLTLCPLDAKNNKWCWCALFAAYAVETGNKCCRHSFQVYVLMNGATITEDDVESRREPDTEETNTKTFVE